MFSFKLITSLLFLFQRLLQDAHIPDSNLIVLVLHRVTGGKYIWIMWRGGDIPYLFWMTEETLKYDLIGVLLEVDEVDLIILFERGSTNQEPVMSFICHDHGESPGQIVILQCIHIGIILFHFFK